MYKGIKHGSSVCQKVFPCKSHRRGECTTSVQFRRTLPLTLPTSSTSNQAANKQNKPQWSRSLLQVSKKLYRIESGKMAHGGNLIKNLSCKILCTESLVINSGNFSLKLNSRDSEGLLWSESNCTMLTYLSQKGEWQKDWEAGMAQGRGFPSCFHRILLRVGLSAACWMDKRWAGFAKAGWGNSYTDTDTHRHRHTDT